MKKQIQISDVQEFCNILVRAVETVARLNIPEANTGSYWCGKEELTRAALLSDIFACRSAMDQIKAMAEQDNGKH